jgi:hypothetical protein
MSELMDFICQALRSLPYSLKTKVKSPVYPSLTLLVHKALGESNKGINFSP